MDLKEALNKAKTNDQLAYKYLLDNLWNEVYLFQLKRTKNENDAEDITIQTFSKAFDKIHTFNNKYVFKTWLISISKNIHIDFIRKQKSTLETSSFKHESNNDYHSIIDDTPSPEDKLISEQHLASLLQDIKKLKPHYQEVINLRYFQELSYKEISKQLNEPLNSIKVKLLRAKKLLTEIIQKS